MRAGEIPGAPRLGTFVGLNARCSRCGRVHGIEVFEGEDVRLGPTGLAENFEGRTGVAFLSWSPIWILAVGVVFVVLWLWSSRYMEVDVR